MEPILFAVSFWGWPGTIPDPYPNLMFSEFRQEGQRPTIWIGFSSSGVYLGGSPAPQGFREYIESRVFDFMANYIY